MLYFTVAIDSTSGQCRLWSACASAQADQSLRCPHIKVIRSLFCTRYHLVHVGTKLSISFELTLTQTFCACLRGPDTLGKLSAILQGRQLLWLLFCFPAHHSPCWKRVYSKRKEFAPMGSKFFPFRVDPFSEGRQNNFDRVASPERYQFPSSWITNSECTLTYTWKGTA